MIDDSIFSEIEERNAAISQHRPLNDFEVQQAKEFFCYETTWSSNALEGNTLDLTETQILLKDGITSAGHSVREIHECLGHEKAYNFMYTLIKNKNVTLEEIKTLHSLFTTYLDDIPNAGDWRQVSVIITGSKYSLPKYEDVPGLMDGFAKWMQDNRDKMNKLVFASEAHRRFVYIHPFADGNGRVARLLTNTILLQEGYLPISIPPVRRNDYIHALENGRKDADPFTNFIGEMELMVLTDYMRMLHIDYTKK